MYAVNKRLCAYLWARLVLFCSFPERQAGRASHVIVGQHAPNLGLRKNLDKEITSKLTPRPPGTAATHTRTVDDQAVMLAGALLLVPGKFAPPIGRKQ